MQVSTARREVVEVLSALAVERYHLAVQDCFLDWQDLTGPVAELLEPLEDVPPLGPEVTAVPGHVEQPAVSVILGLEEPGGVIERVGPGGESDRLDGGEGPTDSWAQCGLVGSLRAAGGPPHEEVYN
jgi:hypothetical protein